MFTHRGATRAATAPLLTSIEMLVASSVVVCCRRSGWHPAFRSRVPCRGRQASTWHWRASFDKLGRALSLPWAAAVPGRLRRARRRARGQRHRRRPMESKIYYSTNLVYANKPSARSKLPIPLQAHKALSARKGDAGAAYAAGHPTRSNYTLIEGLACPTRSIASDTPSDRCRTAYRRTACYSCSYRSSHTVMSAFALWEWCVRRSCSRPRVGTGNNVLPGQDLSQPQTALGV